MSGRLRVVGGALSGRRFASKIASVTRPTSDRVREAIASAIESRGGFVDTSVLDLFAGTGAMAIEALSRGAASAVLVEKDRSAARGIEENLRALGLSDRARVVAIDLGPSSLAKLAGPFDRVFLDPPYADASSAGVLLDALAPQLVDGALVVLEHPNGLVPTLGAAFEPLVNKRYGDSAVVIARYAAAG